MKNWQLFFFYVVACFTWTQEPTERPTEASAGTIGFLQWNFESVGDSFWFGLLLRNTSTPNNVNESSKLDIALKLPDGSTFLIDEFKKLAELKDQATLILHSIIESDEGRY